MSTVSTDPCASSCVVFTLPHANLGNLAFNYVACVGVGSRRKARGRHAVEAESSIFVRQSFII